MKTTSITPKPNEWTPAASGGGKFMLSANVPFDLWLGDGMPEKSDVGHTLQPGAMHPVTLGALSAAFVRIGIGYGANARIVVTEGAL